MVGIAGRVRSGDGEPRFELSSYSWVVGFAVPSGARLVRVIGAGSVFEVAIVEHDGRRCLCKRLKPRSVGEPLAELALRREIQALKSARALESVPKLLSEGHDDSGPYVIESLIEALSLRQVVDGYLQSSAAVPAELLSNVTIAAISALAELHAVVDAQGVRLGLVHGDLGPDHVLLGRGRGEVYFVDFGLARWRGMDEPCGAERGTLPYVAPEIARGEAQPSQGGDVYALAATVAFMAIGQDPCRSGAPAAQLIEIAEQGVNVEALASCRNLLPHVRAALERALAFEPADRAGVAGELAKLVGSPGLHR